MTQTISKNSDFKPKPHAAIYRDYSDMTFCVDHFRARNFDQAVAFARKRAPKGTHAVTVIGADQEAVFHTGFSRAAVDRSRSGFEGGCAGA